MSSTFLQPSSLKSKIELIEVMLHKFKSQNASVEIDLWLQISSEHFFALSDFLDHESQDGVFFLDHQIQHWKTIITYCDFTLELCYLI